MNLFGIRISSTLKLALGVAMILTLSAFVAGCSGASPKEQPRVVMETNRGVIVIELFTQDAPITTGNFQSLVEKSFYDSLTFHRVEPGFVVQGGDPRGDGQGGPGYTIRDEYNERKHVRGAVGMAKSDMPNSAGSQFYICLEDSFFLDGRYTVFGRVVEGMEVVDTLQVGDVMNKVYMAD